MSYGFERRAWKMASAPASWRLDGQGKRIDESEADEKVARVAAALERLAENTAKEARRESQ